MSGDISPAPAVRDVIVVGGGAAGLMAAASAAARGRDVLVLEKNRKLGVKVLMSGGTRCNITHACDQRGIAEAFGRQGRFLRSALATLTPEQVIEKIESLGVATKVEDTGKVFPVSNRAIDVRDALVTLAENAGAEILTEMPVSDIQFNEESGDCGLFSVAVDDHTLTSRSLVLTTGGLSYPGSGTTGDGYAWARLFGHTITSTYPALTPVVSHETWVQELKGITIQDVGLSLWPEAGVQGKKKKPLDTRRGPLLFTHFGFSGPTVMNLSRSISSRASEETPGQLASGEALVLRCDFMPSTPEPELSNQLQAKKQSSGSQPVAGFLPKALPRRLVEALLRQAEIPEGLNHAELSKKLQQNLIAVLKRNEVAVHGTLGYNKAEVTAGGVSLKEVDSRNMQSKLRAGLYLAGEILDVDGPIGGFNFQAAFSTGWLAGQHA